MPKKVALTKSVYLGGLPDTKPSRQSLNLYFTDEGIGQGMFGPKNIIKWEDIAGVSFDSTMAKKSRAGKAVAFGVFALAAKNTQNAAEVTVLLKDGNVALYRVTGKSGAQVRGKVQPFLAGKGVPCLDDGPVAESAALPVSAADEIAKLAELHKAGALTDEEFAAHKAKLL